MSEHDASQPYMNIVMGRLNGCPLLTYEGQDKSHHFPDDIYEFIFLYDKISYFDQNLHIYASLPFLLSFLMWFKVV